MNTAPAAVPAAPSLEAPSGHDQPAPERIEAAAALLAQGGLVAFPTETVYGLGADASDPAAVARIYQAKGRPADHPVIVHVHETQAVKDWAEDISAPAWRLMQACWPGPLTLILKRRGDVPDAVSGGQDSIGLRCPDHPVALDLLRRFARRLSVLRPDAPAGIAAPSANRFGRISPTTAAHVREELQDRIDDLLDGGPCQVGIESTIVDARAEPLRVLRPGHLSAERLAAIAGVAVVNGAAIALPGASSTASDASGVARIPDARQPATVPDGQSDGQLDGRLDAQSAPTRVSGSLAAHYAPRTPLLACPAAELADRARAMAQAHGVPPVVLAREAAVPPAADWVRMPAEPADYARVLYGALRQADARHAPLILIETLPDTPAWCAVRDRVGRAVTGSGAASATPSPAPALTAFPHGLGAQAPGHVNASHPSTDASAASN